MSMARSTVGPGAPSRAAHLQVQGAAADGRARAARPLAGRLALAFRETYNTAWLIERHGFRLPSAVRQDQLSTAALAA